MRGCRAMIEGDAMSITDLQRVVLRGMLAVALIAGVGASAGCDKSEKASSGEAESPAEEPAGEQERPEGYSSWTITVVDDDTYTEGDITYSIALNLTATNPTQSIDGAYSGTATANTTTTGVVQGMPLNASAIVNSSLLEFTLADESGTSDGLAPLTAEGAVYSGSGSIVMAASGSGTVGPAGGSFQNTSGQNLQVRVQGSAVTLSVDISGHTYTFQGTITGNP
jgi:hypothetical protein